jgi:hypothetical protein
MKYAACWSRLVPARPAVSQATSLAELASSFYACLMLKSFHAHSQAINTTPLHKSSSPQQSTLWSAGNRIVAFLQQVMCSNHHASCI